MAISVLIKNKEGRIRTDCIDGKTRYLTEQEYDIEMQRKKLRKLEKKERKDKYGTNISTNEY